MTDEGVKPARCCCDCADCKQRGHHRQHAKHVRAASASKPETLQDTFRRLLKGRMGVCDKCGRPSGSLRELSADIGLPGAATLWRFLEGHDASGGTLDKILAYLVKVGARP